MKIRPVGAEMYNTITEEWTDMTKLIIGFRNFANAPKEGPTYIYYQPAHKELFCVYVHPCIGSPIYCM
jgi:hypothetical protein